MSCHTAEPFHPGVKNSKAAVVGGNRVKSDEKCLFFKTAFVHFCVLTSFMWVWVRETVKKKSEIEIVGVFYRMLANMMFYVSIKSSKAMLTFHGLETRLVLCENGCIVWNPS